MNEKHQPSAPPVARRRLLNASALAAGGALLAGCGESTGALTDASSSPEAHTVPPTEALMGEHGLLQRILLIYDTAIARIDDDEHLPAKAIHAGAQVVGRLVHSHHERLEEVYVFPRLGRAGKLGGTIATLTVQHQRGRALTERVRHATRLHSLSRADRRQLVSAMGRFTRMYRPHEAREDTVVFPAFRELVPARKLAELGERFDDKERRRFGEDGVTEMLDRVASIEEMLGIHDLTQFTPQI